MLGALHVKARLSNELRQPLEKIQRFDQQMNTLLEMKGKYSAGYIQAGYSSAQRVWEMKQEYRPPRYTACRNELLKVDQMRPVT